MSIRYSLLALAVAASSAVAQAPASRVGVFAGMNQAHVDGSGVSDISNHSGGAFGAYLLAPLAGSDWSFQTGAMFTMKGWERVEPGTRDLAVVKLNYVEVPLALRYDFARAERVGGFVFGGAGLGFRKDCSIAASSNATGATATADCDALSSVKFASYDVGALAGGGVRFGLGRQNLVLTAQYEHGLRDVEEGRDIKNRAFTFGAGIELPLSRK